MRAGFDFVPTVRDACCTDIYPLYFGRGLADGKSPTSTIPREPVQVPRPHRRVHARHGGDLPLVRR